MYPAYNSNFYSKSVKSNDKTDITVGMRKEFRHMECANFIRKHAGM